MRIFIPQLPEVDNVSDLRRSVYEGFKKIVDQLQGVSDSVPAKTTTTTVATKKGISTSSLGGGVGVTGASTINNATLGTPTYVNNGDGTVSVTLPWTAPAVPGEFIGIHVYVEDPDQSSGNKGTNLTGSTTFGGNPDMSGTWQPADLGKFTSSPAVFNLNQQTNSRTIRIYGVSYSTSIENDLVRYGATGASPSTTLLIDPVGVVNGEEYARLVTNVAQIDYGSGVLGIRFLTDYTAGQRWSEGVTWSWPTAPPSPTQGQIDTVRLVHRYQMLFQDGSAMPDTLWADVGYPFTKNEDVQGWPLIPYHYKFTTYFVSGSGGNFNSIVDGVTPSVSYEFDWPLSANTYAPNVTGASVAVTTPTSSDGTNMKLVTATFTPPAANTWGGVFLRVYDGSSLVKENKGVTSPVTVLIQNPNTAKTYTWKLVTFDVNNKVNAEDGSTPQGNIAVGSAAGTLNGANLVVSSVSTISLNSTKIMVGGGGSKPGYFEVYNGAGSAIGFIGTQTGASYNATALTSAQNGYTYTITSSGSTNWTLIGAANNNVGTTFTKSGGTGAGSGTATINQDGAWFSQLRVGSTSWANAPFYVDGSGNVLIDNSNDTTKTATFKLNSNGITTTINNTSQDPTNIYAGLTIINNSATSESSVVTPSTFYLINSSNKGVVSIWNNKSSFAGGGVVNTYTAGGTFGASIGINGVLGVGEVIVYTSGTADLVLRSGYGLAFGGTNVVIDTSRNGLFNSLSIGGTTRITSSGNAELNSYCKVGSYYGVVTSGSGSTQKRIVTGFQALSGGQLTFSTGLSTTESFVATLAYNGTPTEYLSVYGNKIYSSDVTSSNYVFWQAVGY